MQRKQQVGECWVYVIFFACAYGGEVRMSALQLSDPKGTFWLFIDFMAIYSCLWLFLEVV